MTVCLAQESSQFKFSSEICHLRHENVSDNCLDREPLTCYRISFEKKKRDVQVCTRYRVPKGWNEVADTKSGQQPTGLFTNARSVHFGYCLGDEGGQQTSILKGKKQQLVAKLKTYIYTTVIILDFHSIPGNSFGSEKKCFHYQMLIRFG